MGHARKDPPPPHGGNYQYPPPPLRTSYINLRHSLDDSPPPLPGRRKFPLWVGNGSFLERPNVCPLSCSCGTGKQRPCKKEMLNSL